MAYEWLHGKESEIVQREKLPFDGRLRITRRWKITNNTQRQVGELRLEVYTDTSNETAQSYVADPWFGRKEQVTGTFRNVRVWSEFDPKRGEGYIYQTLEEGFLEAVTTGAGDAATFDWSNARVLNGALSAVRLTGAVADNLDSLTVYWRGVSPSKVRTCTASLVALPDIKKWGVDDAGITITISGESWGSGWYLLGADPTIAEDGTGTVVARFGSRVQIVSEDSNRFSSRTTTQKHRLASPLTGGAATAGTTKSTQRGRDEGMHTGSESINTGTEIIFPANADDGTPQFRTTARTQAYTEQKRVLQSVAESRIPTFDDENVYGFVSWSLSPYADRFDVNHTIRDYNAFYQGTAGSWDEAEYGPFKSVKIYRGNSGQPNRYIVYEKYVYIGDDVGKAVSWLAGTHPTLPVLKGVITQPNKFIDDDRSGYTIRGSGRIDAWATIISSEGGVIAGNGNAPVASADY